MGSRNVLPASAGGTPAAGAIDATGRSGASAGGACARGASAGLDLRRFAMTPVYTHGKRTRKRTIRRDLPGGGLGLCRGLRPLCADPGPFRTRCGHLPRRDCLRTLAIRSPAIGNCSSPVTFRPCAALKPHTTDEVRRTAGALERIRGWHGGPGPLRGVRAAHGRMQALPGGGGQHPPDDHALPRRRTVRTADCLSPALARRSPPMLGAETAWPLRQPAARFRQPTLMAPAWSFVNKLPNG